MRPLLTIPSWLTLLLAIHLLVSPLMAQPTTVAQAHSLVEVLKNSKPDINRVAILLQLSNFYLRKTLNAHQALDSALILAGQAEELGKIIGFAKARKKLFF